MTNQRIFNLRQSRENSSIFRSKDRFLSRVYFLWLKKMWKWCKFARRHSRLIILEGLLLLQTHHFQICRRKIQFFRCQTRKIHSSNNHVFSEARVIITILDLKFHNQLSNKTHLLKALPIQKIQFYHKKRQEKLLRFHIKCWMHLSWEMITIWTWLIGVIQII